MKKGLKPVSPNNRAGFYLKTDLPRGKGRSSIGGGTVSNYSPVTAWRYGYLLLAGVIGFFALGMWAYFSGELIYLGYAAMVLVLTNIFLAVGEMALQREIPQRSVVVACLWIPVGLMAVFQIFSSIF